MCSFDTPEDYRSILTGRNKPRALTLNRADWNQLFKNLAEQATAEQKKASAALRVFPGRNADSVVRVKKELAGQRQALETVLVARDQLNATHQKLVDATQRYERHSTERQAIAEKIRECSEHLKRLKEKAKTLRELIAEREPYEFELSGQEWGRRKAQLNKKRQAADTKVTAIRKLRELTPNWKSCSCRQSSGRRSPVVRTPVMHRPVQRFAADAVDEWDYEDDYCYDVATISNDQNHQGFLSRHLSAFFGG